MQLTRLDRWLREKFVYETHIYTLRPPESLPRGVVATELPEKPGRRFRHQYVARHNEDADELIRHLKDSNMMFTTRIVDRNAWFVRFIAPKDRSVTWFVFSTMIILAAITATGFGVFRLLSNPEIRQNLLDALDVFKG